MTEVFSKPQIVFDETLENFKDVAKLPIATAIKVTGDLVKTEGAKQPFEIKAKSIVSRSTI